MRDDEASGAGYFECESEGFKRISKEVGSEDEVRRELLEADTCKLVPPTLAASLFIVTGIHPAWGLRAVHSFNRDVGFGPFTRPDYAQELVEGWPVVAGVAELNDGQVTIDGDAVEGVETIQDYFDKGACKDGI